MVDLVRMTIVRACLDSNHTIALYGHNLIMPLLRGPSAAQNQALAMDMEHDTYLVEERQRDMRQLEVTSHPI